MRNWVEVKVWPFVLGNFKESTKEHEVHRRIGMTGYDRMKLMR